MSKNKKFRDWNAVNAQFRNSAGPIKERKSSDNKYKCRNWKQNWRSKYSNIEQESKEIEEIKKGNYKYNEEW